MSTATTRETGTPQDTRGELPQPGTWKVDPGHAEVGFVGRHLKFTKVRGRFVGINATVEVGRHVQDTRVRATIQMASVDSGDTTRDDHLRSGDLFDSDNHPTATFRSTGLQWEGRSGTLTGELTIKGITRPVTLDVEFLGTVTDPWDNQRAVFDAQGRINREDWGITWNMALEAGGLLVSKEIDLVLHVELVRE
jgi:polyisoprenoid-binding protein YceI